MDNKELWQSTLGELELQITKPNFQTWFKNSDLIEKGDDYIVIGLESAFAKEWVETKYHKLILKIVRNFEPEIKEIRYQIQPPTKPATIISKKKVTPSQETEVLNISEFNIDPRTNLNSRYTFQNFIVGANNELAYSAATAIIKDLGKKYNPLFIYGGVGLGKTHLIQATGNELKKIYKNKIGVRYVSTETFVNEVINGIKNKRMEDVKNKYRKVDVLIVDDIQFIAGKDKTQEEFFHNFNSLYQRNKQIILSSDRHPNNIPAITERLKSRFEGGMIADINMPDFETRTAILKQKMEEKGIIFEKEVIEFVANNIQKNIRELESAINRLIIFKKSNNKNPTIEDVKKLLKTIIISSSKVTNPKKIIEAIVEFYDIPSGNMFYSSRKKEFSKPRQIAMYLLKKELKLSYSEIGRKFGGKDHTTVIHACQLVDKLWEEDEKIHQEIELILQRIYAK